MIRQSWHKARIALQILAEERVGAPTRAAAAIEEAREEIAFEDARKRLRRAR